MKKSKVIAILSALTIFCSAANGTTGNYPMPSMPDTLRILAIGNSFSDDGMMWLPNLIEAADIHNVILGRIYIGGCSLERHCKEYETASNNYIYYKSVDNNWKTVSKKAGMLQALKDEKWDIISLQQASGASGMASSYTPWLDRLIGIVRENCPNPKACIVWHQTWAYSRNSSHREFPNYGKDQIRMYYAINEMVEKVCKDYDINTIIPSGTTIQLLRDTSINDDNDLTRDGYHLNKQFGRYAAACAWFEAIIRPVFGKSVKRNACTLKGTGHQISKREAAICQKAAIRATSTFRQ